MERSKRPTPAETTAFARIWLDMTGDAGESACTAFSLKGHDMKVNHVLPACVAGMALAVGLIAVPANSPAAPARKPRIAILDFDYGTVRTYANAWFGADVDLGKGIQQMLVTDLVKDGTYSVIERAVMDKILAEQNFSNSNRADATSAA